MSASEECSVMNEQKSIPEIKGALRVIISILLLSNLFYSYAQDTLRVMHYNLLDYGNSGFCTNSTNNTDLKDAYLRSIVTYVKPDILTVNEISKLSTYHTRILSEVMNQTGYALFKMAASPNIADSYIVNQLYYNSEKLELHSQEVLQSEIRDIDLYRLYHLNEGLADGDTIFINCVVAHLKAGSGGDDEDDRALMVSNMLNYLESNEKPGNYFFMGDLNLYESAEEAYQLLLNNNDRVFRYYDPIEQSGDWHEEIAFSSIHTQSTRESNSGCGASGGMDDRFDFILLNEIMKNSSDKVFYLDGSYQALGQDGNRLNGSISDPPNTSLPAYLIDALYGMSDHLPVILDVIVDESLDISDPLQVNEQKIKVHHMNPVWDDLKINILSKVRGEAKLSIVSITGRELHRQQLTLESNNIVSIPLTGMSQGTYILRISHPKAIHTSKFMIIR